MPIRILDPQVVSKIAAGEVVERPASVVKELVENSLDAGANQITIEAQGGGVNLLRVIDNGCGIPSAEVEVAFSRHATSKLSALDDLETISTLGFRGEAMPSIASVADVELLTKATGDPTASYIRVENSEIVLKEKRSRPQGTTITVHHLFRHFPARLKFLKSAATENSHIAELVTQYALAYPEVKFSLTLEGRLALHTPGNGSLRDTVLQIYGLEVAQQMLEVAITDQIFEIKGLLSPPSLSRSNRNYLSFFVNRRWVRSSLLTRSIEDAYQGLLMVGKHPMAILTISLPPQEIDVNVHPSKTEVKFRNNQAVFGSVVKAVKSALNQSQPPMIKGVESKPPASQRLFTTETERAATATVTYHVPASSVGGVKNGDNPSLPVLRVLGQLASSYIMAEGPEGLYLVDQHAAHERIIFDKILAQHSSKKIEIQGLLEPMHIELSPEQEQKLNDRNELLSQFGFSLEHFGERSYLLRAVPAVVAGANLAEAVKSLLDSLGTDEEPAKREEKIAESLACHGAIKAGQSLSSDEMRALMRQLEGTTSPRTCPHGRPTMIYLSSKQLEKEFGR
jgi:DNA mismatch repair protein MutL